MQQPRQNKILAMILAISVLSILIITGPAKAFILDLTSASDKLDVLKGDSIVFNASIKMNSDESLPIEKIILQLEGPENMSCEFYPNTTKITDCKGISSITEISKDLSGYGPSSQYGYKYGYNNGYSYDSGYSYDFGYGYGYSTDLTYEITLSTADYLAGEYKTRLIVPMDNKNFSKEDGPTFNIISIPEVVSSNRRHYTQINITCTEDAWQCSDWSECINLSQTRVCSNTQSNCLLSSMPDESRICSVENNSTNSNSLDNLSNDSLDSTSETDILQNNRLSGITGAVIGNIGESPAKIGVVILITVLITLSIIFIIRLVLKHNRLKQINTLKL